MKMLVVWQRLRGLQHVHGRGATSRRAPAKRLRTFDDGRGNCREYNLQLLGDGGSTCRYQSCRLLS